MLLAMGTRPEVIKMQSIYHRLKSDSFFDPIICFTGQHMELCEPLFEFFKLKIHHSLALMEKGQTLSRLASKTLASMPKVLSLEQPDIVLVQGDTTTALTVALSAFHEQIPVGHVEAGLRTGDLAAPFPEEGNRSLISRIATFHFAPTELAKLLLNKENIFENVYVTGNTVIDSLLQTKRRVGESIYNLQYFGINGDFVLITIHRRESFGLPINRICGAIKRLSGVYPKIDFVIPVHPNPIVNIAIHQILSGLENVKLIDPLPYAEFVYLMARCRLLLTDSGGVQEEAPALGKPIVVLRETTERSEIAELYSVKLVGSDPDKIFNASVAFLHESNGISPNYIFGNGKAADNIAEILRKSFYDN